MSIRQGNKQQLGVEQRLFLGRTVVEHGYMDKLD